MCSLQERHGADPSIRRPLAAAIWESSGITEHMGGLPATQRLLRLCAVGPGQTIIDAGCGTGITACYLARTYGVRVLAVDLSARSVAEARRRVAAQGLTGSVAVTRADAQALPAAAGAFDVALLESVAIFCDPERLTTEVWRVLKPGGALAANELTLLATPPAELAALLETLGIHARQEAEWRDAWARAGFEGVVSEVRRISLRERFIDHLRKEGLVGYLSAAFGALGDRRIRQVFMNRALLRAARRFLPVVGYGLYVARKAGAQTSLPGNALQDS